ncbi:MAG: outer membrane beta-barrel protein [Sphingobium sp.]
MSSDHLALPVARRAAATGFVLLASLGLNSGTARAQTVSTLIAPVIAPDYARGRNIGVAEETHPAYRPTGLRIGAFDVYPSIEATTHYSTNVYLDNANRRGDAFLSLMPRLSLASNWARHRISVHANADIRRYARETLRDQDNFLVDVQARLDIASHWTLTASFQASRATENPFAQDLAREIAVLSQYVRLAPSVRLVRQVGRTRLTASVERLRLDFDPIRLAGGVERTQDDRSRTITRVAVQGEYALSPGLSLYGQVNQDDTRYDRAPGDGNERRDSRAHLFIGGVNVDVAGLMRGSIGIGHTRRDYRGVARDEVRALSVQARVAIFPSPLTTVTVSAQRLVQDAALGDISAYRDTRAGLQIDHALLRNLLLSITATAARQRLLDDGRGTRLFVTTGSAFYQSNRWFGLGLTAQYNRSRPYARSFGLRSDEIVGMLSVRLRR